MGVISYGSTHTQKEGNILGMYTPGGHLRSLLTIGVMSSEPFSFTWKANCFSGFPLIVICLHVTGHNYIIQPLLAARKTGKGDI